ncbi:DUF2442 domain-containing protein [Leptolyngbya sp. CCY15150]|uniref:DUF2442 domain-containing protein n=1 Tax=Leptolyngbya sp. CCY15150 TaxID=2767772 RepID=UPI001950F26E|nr:DUF2442 domain-containing protein [Leptolyngbya sp. CCY15150]
MNYPRIHTAQVLDDTTLLIEFTNQEQKIYDISPLLNRPMFAPLRSPAFFKNFQIEPGGYAIAWNTEIDLSEYELWKNGVPIHPGISRMT